MSAYSLVKGKKQEEQRNAAKYRERRFAQDRIILDHAQELGVRISQVIGIFHIVSSMLHIIQLSGSKQVSIFIQK